MQASLNPAFLTVLPFICLLFVFVAYWCVEGRHGAIARRYATDWCTVCVLPQETCTLTTTYTHTIVSHVEELCFIVFLSD